MTVGAAAGQVLLDGGGSVTVEEAGEITGVAGERDAVRSERGALGVTVCIDSCER